MTPLKTQSPPGLPASAARRSQVAAAGSKGLARRASAQDPAWTFLSNHAHVLLCIARDPDVRMRDVARLVGITERTVQRIVADLEEAGYIKRMHHGRRNRYAVRAELPLRHPIERHEQVSSLIALVPGELERERKNRSRPRARQ